MRYRKLGDRHWTAHELAVQVLPGGWWRTGEWPRAGDTNYEQVRHRTIRTQPTPQQSCAIAHPLLRTAAHAAAARVPLAERFVGIAIGIARGRECGSTMNV
jgi:hypothetical protein